MLDGNDKVIGLSSILDGQTSVTVSVAPLNTAGNPAVGPFYLVASDTNHSRGGQFNAATTVGTRIQFDANAMDSDCPGEAPPNTAPIANAGPDQNVAGGAGV